MGIKGGHRNNNYGFGNLVSLRPVTYSSSISTTNNNNAKPRVPKTRVIRISEPLYQKFVNFSRRYYDVESYSTILENLINDFKSRNQDKSWRDMDR